MVAGSDTATMIRRREWLVWLVELAGLSAVVAGVVFIWWPAALIIGGGAVIFLAQGLWRSE